MITDLAKKYYELKQKSNEASEALKLINAEWDEAEKALLEAMVEEGVSSTKIEGLGNFILSTKTYLSLNAANKEQGYQYLKDSGNGSLLQEYVNPRTLGSFLDVHLAAKVSALLATGLDIVDARREAIEQLGKNGFSYFTDRKISLRSK